MQRGQIKSASKWVILIRKQTVLYANIAQPLPITRIALYEARTIEPGTEQFLRSCYTALTSWKDRKLFMKAKLKPKFIKPSASRSTDGSDFIVS